MITREQKIRLSIFLILAGGLLAAIAAVFIMPTLKEEGDTYYIDFRDMSVNGVNDGADVKYQGVRVGQVSRIDVNRDDLRSILIYIKLKKGFPIKSDMTASLQYAGITGLKFIELSGGKEEAKTLNPGDKIQTRKGLGEKAEDIVLNIDSVVEAINNMLNPENRQKFAQLLANLESGTAVMAQILDKRQNSLANTISNIEKITRHLDELSLKMDKFAGYLNQAQETLPASRLREVLDHLDQVIVTIDQRLSKDELGRVLDSVDKFADSSTIAIRKIENRIGDMEAELSRTLSALRESMENIARFTRDLREDPTLLIRRRADKERSK